MSARITRRHFITAALTTGLGTAFLSGCATRGAASTTSLALIAGVDAPFYTTMMKGAQEEAAKRSVLLSYSAPKAWNAGQQTAQVNAYIGKGVDAIIIAPNDSNALIEPLKQANDLGIKIITVDTYLGKDGDYTQGTVTFPLAYIGSDNMLGGQKAAEALIASLGGKKGQVYIQNNDRGTSTAQQRAEGFRAAIAATNGALTVVGENYDEGDIPTATAQCSAILERYPDLLCIFAATGNSTEGVVAAVKNAGKGSLINIVGFDAVKQSVEGVRAGVVSAVIGQQPALMGAQAVDYALQALSGNSHLSKHVTADLLVITKDNIDTPPVQAVVYEG